MKINYSHIISGLVIAIMLIALGPNSGFAKEKRDSSEREKWDERSSVSYSNREKEVVDKSSENNDDDWLEDAKVWLKDHAPIANAQTSEDKMPVISGIKSPTVLNVNQTGTWTIKAFDPENGSLEYSVDWGDSAMNGLMAKMTAQVFTQTSTFTHAYAATGEYKIRFTVRDDSNNLTESTVTVHVQGSTSQPPIISNLSATSSSRHKGVVKWNTDTKATSMVWISTTSPVNLTGDPTINRSDRVRKHKIEIKKLEPNTTYYVVVGSRNSSDMITMSVETSFTTLPDPIPANQLPSISSLDGPNTLLVNQAGTWTIKAFDPENGSLEYSVDWGDSAMNGLMAKMTAQVFTQTSTFTHAYAVAGTYAITFTTKDDRGQMVSTSTTVMVNEIPDTIPPTINGITIPTVGSTTATIAWITDEDSTSKVFYSTVTPVDMSGTTTMSITDSTLVKSHLLNIVGLATSAQYYLKVQSADVVGNLSTSDEFTLTTGSGI